ncbi:Transketolase domain protein (plasmid) [Novosphingobium aromaticivorans DSM 12444]|uniref:Transketolase domain protein n=1 Tax=Novosphingobium aromaticivorans (strain ATCC 700278 / DSM 12444 / CCUG 56034 / CIP 105152 / NBRC 16084 / F199) TaxID=279238 RepID=A4XF90_NOVAD|nr:transketolase C-terminal domain-containing protein [Novosphingobium aromaticivorans]ABP64601.1 Transketolase domain protein [Novosphingobium aromaticivorans DSM 12444]SCY94943.1 pyruvate dehydrogenase E1 component beta subunit [Novosphingobium aromaticivorans]
MSSETMGYNAAMGLGLVEEMRRDDSIFIMGQGVVTGGWFGMEKGLVAEFGNDRVLDCGIAEAFEAGLAAGAAIAGMKPVINMGFGDFALIAGDEIYHKLAKWRYMHGLDVPMTAVIIFPIGAMGGAGPEHSSCTEVLGMHFPGLKVVVPSTAEDAKGLMKAALREPNPVLFHSVQGLGWSRGDVPLDPDFVVPIGKAVTRRRGADLSIVTYGSMAPRSLKAAERLASEGIDAEVIDLRSLVPLDWEHVLESVSRTHRAMVVHEAFRTAGPGAEIAAQIQERAFFDLDAPVLRLGARDFPLCQNADLEQAAIPSVDAIAAEARRLAAI